MKQMLYFKYKGIVKNYGGSEIGYVWNMFEGI